MKKIYLYFFPILIVFSLIVLIPIKEYNLYNLLYNSGKICGLIALFFLSILVISGDTARFFDRFFGIDKIIKFQKEFSFVTLVFIILHPLFFIIANKNLKFYLIPDFIYISLALGIISFYFYIIIMICSALYKRISYYYWQVIHIIIYLM